MAGQRIAALAGAAAWHGGLVGRAGLRARPGFGSSSERMALVFGAGRLGLRTEEA